MTEQHDFDDLDCLLRRARPDIPHRGAPLNARERTVLADIMAEPAAAQSDRRHRQRRPRRSAVWLAAACVLVAVALAIASVSLLKPQRAYAATPPVLTATALSSSPADVLVLAADRLRPLATAPTSHTFYTWALASEPDEKEQLRSFVQPMVATAAISADEASTTMVWKAGDPSPANAPGAARPGGEVPDYPPSDYPVMFADAPTEPAEWAPYLVDKAFLPERPTTGDYLLGLQSLLVERLLNSAQEAALLRFLATLPNLTVDGTVLDRLGRAGVALSTTDRLPEQFIDTVVVSTSGDGLLSAEMTYTGKERADIQAPAVILYYAWER